MELLGEGAPLRQRIVASLLALWRPCGEGRIQVLDVYDIEIGACGAVRAEAKECVQGRRIGVPIQVSFPCGTVRLL